MSQQRVIAEVDGFAFSRHAVGVERDRRRDAEARRPSPHRLRFTWRELTRRPEAVIARIAAVLSRETIM